MRNLLIMMLALLLGATIAESREETGSDLARAVGALDADAAATDNVLMAAMMPSLDDDDDADDDGDDGDDADDDDGDDDDGDDGDDDDGDDDDDADDDDGIDDDDDADVGADDLDRRDHGGRLEARRDLTRSVDASDTDAKGDVRVRSASDR